MAIFINGITQDVTTRSINVILNYRNPCVAATTGSLNATYANGVLGVGATLINAGTLAAFSIDGISPAQGARILVKNQGSDFQNGIYSLTTVGSGAIAWILTRTTDFDVANEIEVDDLVPVRSGTVNAQTVWRQTATVATMGSDSVQFSQYQYGPSTFCQTANNLNDVNSISSARSNLGLAIGTNVQAWNANLDTVASNYVSTTFTPTVTLVGGSGNTVPQYTVNSARYTQIGNLVTAYVLLSGDGGNEGAGSGQLNINLPVTASGSAVGNVFSGGFVRNGATDEPLLGQVSASATTIAFYTIRSSALTSLKGSDQNNTTRIIEMGFTYEV